MTKPLSTFLHQHKKRNPTPSSLAKEHPCPQSFENASQMLPIIMILSINLERKGDTATTT
jgi:hypothetical protein